MIKPATVDFLLNLKANNNKPWFEENRSSFNLAHENVRGLADFLLTAFTPYEPDLGHLSAKDTLYRIYRDVRFSPDKSPYKTYMGISLHTGYSKDAYAGYYIHIQPNHGSFLVGGLYKPTGQNLKKIRQEIDYNLPAWKAILDDDEFVSYFGGLQTDGLALNRVPAGFPADSPAASFLKLKSFVAARTFRDEELTRRAWADQLLEGMTLLQPLVHFLNQALKPAR